IGIGLLVGVLFGFFFANRIIDPIRRLTRAMTQLAEGELGIDVPDHGRRDEIGDMAAALQGFQENAIESERLVKERETEPSAITRRAQREGRLCPAPGAPVT